jgi:hypothetical protein
MSLNIVAAIVIQPAIGLGFCGQVVADGSVPITELKISVNGKTLHDLEILENQVIDPSTNRTSFLFRKMDASAVIKVGDRVSITVVGSNGETAQKTGSVFSGSSPAAIASFTEGEGQ